MGDLAVMMKNMDIFKYFILLSGRLNWTQESRVLAITPWNPQRVWPLEPHLQLFCFVL
jgi:hypothetical protein